MATTEPIALVQNSNQIQGYRPKLIEFYGYEGEDFRHFHELLDSYLILSNTHSDSRKLAILQSQLRRAAKVYFEKSILKDYPQVTYEKAIELLKNHYITPELIQNYELEFNDMVQGEQEHPQIFLSRLREAADLANITSEAVIESRFRAGLLREIKQFCIQSSARSFPEWLNHAEGWWNANRPRKIAMVDNPFIPRNINNALIYHGDMYQQHHSYGNHNIDLIDANERPSQVIPVMDINSQGLLNSVTTVPHLVNGPHQLSTLEVAGNSRRSHAYPQHNVSHQLSNHNSQQDIVNLIQQTIRHELNSQQQFQPYNRNYNRRSRYNNNNRDYNQNNNSQGYNQNNDYRGNNNGYNHSNGYNSNNDYNNSGYRYDKRNYGRNDSYNQGQNRNNYNNQPYHVKQTMQQSQPQQPSQSKN